MSESAPSSEFKFLILLLLHHNVVSDGIAGHVNMLSRLL